MSWSKHDRRVLIFGAGILAALAALARGLPALEHWSSTKRDAAAEAMREVAAANGGAKLLRTLSDSVNARRERVVSLDTMTIMGGTVAEAGAALSATLSDYADDSSVRVVSMQVRPDTTSARGFARVAVRVVGVGDIRGLTALLDEVEEGTPILAVRDLNISQPDALVADTRPEMLRFDVLVEGLAAIRKADK